MVAHQGKYAFGKQKVNRKGALYLFANYKIRTMLYKIIVLIFLVVVISYGGMAQQKKIDSLLNVLEKTNDVNEIIVLQKIAAYYKEQFDYNKAIMYNNKIAKIAELKNNDILLVSTHIEIFFIYNNLRKNDSALLFERKALAGLLKNNTVSKKLEGQIYGGIGKTFYQSSEGDSCFYYLNKAITLNESISNRNELADNYSYLARYYANRKNDFLKAETLAEKALIIVKETDNRKLEVRILSLLTAVNLHFGKMAKCIELSLKAIKIAEEYKIVEELYTIYALLASYYINMEDYNNAEKYLVKSEKAVKEFNGPKNNLHIVYATFASLYSERKDYNNALIYRKKQLGVSEKLGDKSGMVAAMIQLSSTYINLKQFEEAKSCCDKTVIICKEMADNNRLGLTYRRIGQIYRDAPNSVLSKLNIDTTKKYFLAIEKFKDALQAAGSDDYKEFQIEIWEDLSITYQANKDYINALATYQKYMQIKNAMINNEEKNKINKIEAQYEFKSKEDSLKIIQANTNAALQRQSFLNKTQQQNLIIKDKELLLNKQTLFSNNQQLVLLGKDKELQHLAFLKTQADLQTEQLLKTENEKQLTIIQKEKLLQSSQVKTLSQENELNKLKQRQLLFFSIAGLASLLFVGLYLFNRNRTKQAQLKAELAKEKAEQQTKEAEFQRSIADVSMSALRSQMNPHFIFNCLNSIKLYTTQNDTVAAANYLTKFSKLIRMALENSRSETVTLDAELQSLELYIQMEAMRFKEKLKYSIYIDKNVDSSFIEIPPMLLQPYVENAIWHGLMHKEEGGRIDVGVQVLPNEHTLAITVKDNGVGREKAAQLKSKNAVAHKSYGTKVTNERLDLINQIYKTGASVTTEDVMENGIVAGTLVIIKIPFE
jgi:LytS/YehU family sensor histidine kinase